MINAEITRPKITIVSGIAVKIRPFVKFLSSSATAPIAAEPYWSFDEGEGSDASGTFASGTLNCIVEINEH